MEFMKALPPVVDRILSLFALGIGFPETFFKDVSAPCCLAVSLELLTPSLPILFAWC